MEDSAPQKTKKSRRPSVSHEQWEEMLAAYRDEPTIKHVMETTGVGKRVARRAIQDGWPEYGMTAFRELDHSPVATVREVARLRQHHEDQMMVSSEATRMAAERTMAARIVMDAALHSMRLSQGYAEAALKELTDRNFPMPEDLGPKHVAQIVKALKDSSIVVKTAMEIMREHTGKSEDTINLDIVALIGRCADEELEGVAETGELPARILDHRALVRAQLATSDLSDGEAAAQASVTVDTDGVLVQDPELQVPELEAHEDVGEDSDHGEGEPREEEEAAAG
jgi:hypothetical protein